MEIKIVDEYNEKGHLIYSDNFIGAFARGKTRQEALEKLPKEIASYGRWRGITLDEVPYTITIVQEKVSQLEVCDADSDVLFNSEVPPITRDEYNELKSLVLKSARDFLALYNSIPDKTQTTLTPRKTFYGDVPITPEEMYMHTKSVNSYYFGEIKVAVDNEADIYTCRLRGFEALEKQANFLENVVYDGSYGEQWSLRKLCRRFIWHDRIHAKAMYRVAKELYGEDKISNPFCF